MNDTQTREADGRFGEKVGSDPEVSLGLPVAPRGYELVKPHREYVLWDRMTDADLDRVQDFVRRSGMQVAAKQTRYATEDGAMYKRQFLFADGRRVKGGTIIGEADATQASLHLIGLARDSELSSAAREAYADKVLLARKLFGDEFDDLVTPEPSAPSRARRFWDWLNEQV